MLRIPKYSSLRVGLLVALALHGGFFHQRCKCGCAGVHGLDIHEAANFLQRTKGMEFDGTYIACIGGFKEILHVSFLILFHHLPPVYNYLCSFIPFQSYCPGTAAEDNWQDRRANGCNESHQMLEYPESRSRCLKKLHDCHSKKLQVTPPFR